MSDESDRLFRIRLHHRANGTDRPWGRERFMRLCRRLGCEPQDLAAMFCLPRGMLRAWLERDHIPAYWALHLVHLEQAYWRGKYGARGMPAVPVWEAGVNEDAGAAGGDGVESEGPGVCEGAA